MREIKFRAWDPFNANMMLPTDVNGNNKDLSWFFSQYEELQKSDNNLFLMQYTGLKDKNGVEIYEGDILQWKNAEQETKQHCYLSEGPVVFNRGSFTSQGTRLCDWLTDENGCLAYRNYTEQHGIREDTIYYVHYDIKIIGNIYENPKLLK